MKRPDPEGAVRIGENCFVRAAPSAAGAVLGVVKRGTALLRGEGAPPDGWLAVVYRGNTGWVAGRFAETPSPECRCAQMQRGLQSLPGRAGREADHPAVKSPVQVTKRLVNGERFDI